MKFATLLVAVVTLYVMSDAERMPAQQQPRRAKQMPFHEMAFDPYYAPFYRMPYYSTPGYGAQQQQPYYFRSGAPQQADRADQKVIANHLPTQQRFLFGANIGYAVPSVANNYFLKTSFVFTTATGTICKFVSCITKASFADGAGKVICRRKRYLLEESSADESDDLVMPSKVLQSVTEATFLDKDFKPISDDGNVIKSPYPVLESSLDDTSDSNDSARTKRFAFALTTTVTTYELVTVSSTVTIDPGVVLDCRPANIAVC